MRALLPALLLLTPALAALEAPAPAARKKFSSISLLPDGSELKGVMFPRYDKDHRVIGVLKAKSMTLVNDNTLSGKTVTLESFNPDSSLRGQVDLTQAVFYQLKGLIEAKETVTLHGDRIHARGTGLTFSFESNEGFLIGPVLSWIQHPTATTMNSSPSPIRSSALIGLSLLTLPLNASPPQAVTPEQGAALQADAASTVASANQAATDVRTELTQDSRDAAAAATAANGFVARAGIAAVEAEPPTPEAKPLEVKPGPQDTVITCDGGVYFDADAGVVVYLKNVHVADPRFLLTGARELKIFLEKKPAAAAPAAGLTTTKAAAPDSNNPLGSIGAKFGEVDRVVATGAVHFLQKQPQPGKEPIEASGAIFSYHPKTGQIILSGGYPWVKQGSSFMRAEQPNLILRILKSGSFVTEGKWVMGGNLEQKR